jgi:hypothetical protein
MLDGLRAMYAIALKKPSKFEYPDGRTLAGLARRGLVDSPRRSGTNVYRINNCGVAHLLIKFGDGII